MVSEKCRERGVRHWYGITRMDLSWLELERTEMGVSIVEKLRD